MNDVRNGIINNFEYHDQSSSFLFGYLQCLRKQNPSKTKLNTSKRGIAQWLPDYKWGFVLSEEECRQQLKQAAGPTSHEGLIPFHSQPG